METEKIFDAITQIINAIKRLGHPNWLDYLQVIASIMSIIISALAVIMAVRIPKKIADKQDKIALFDKRFGAYQIFAKYSAFAEQIKNTNGIENYRNEFVNMFGLNVMDEFSGTIALGKLIQVSEPIKNAVFLFDNITDEELTKLYSSICSFVVSLSNNDNVEKRKIEFVENANNFWVKHIEDMRCVLKTD